MWCILQKACFFREEPLLFNSLKKAKFIFLVFIIMIPYTTSGQSDKVLVLWHADSTQTRIQLFTRPVILFGKDAVEITSPIATIQYHRNDIVKFTYENNESVSVKDIDGNQPYRQEDDCLYFDKSINASDITLYSHDGKRIPAKFVQTINGMSLPLTNVPSGIYLLSIKSHSFKFIKR